MRKLRAWAIRLLSLVDGGRREREIDDELESHALRSTPSGFAADHVLAAGLRLPNELAPGGPRAGFFEELRARMEAISGVRSVASWPISRWAAAAIPCNSG